MLRTLVLAFLVMGMASNASALDREYFTIQDVQVSEIADPDLEMQLFGKNSFGLNPDCNVSQVPLMPKFAGEKTGDTFNPIDPINTIEVIVDKIINIGKKVFAVVDAGKPVVNVKLDSANALPQGVTCWADLSGWAMPQTKLYNIQYKNGFGSVVVDFTYRVTFTAGGSVDGIGKYITHATFQPAKIYVAWGFDLDARASIPSVFNRGTSQAPVAGMQMNMEWTVKSPVSHVQRADTFYVGGDGTLQKLD